MIALNGDVRVSSQVGGVHCVSIVPPIPFMAATHQAENYEYALGYALHLSVGLGRRLIDETNTRAAEELRQLQDEYIGMGIDHGLRRLAQGLPLLPAS